jgi:hypothetical protein
MVAASEIATSTPAIGNGEHLSVIIFVLMKRITLLHQAGSLDFSVPFLKQAAKYSWMNAAFGLWRRPQ